MATKIKKGQSVTLSTSEVAYELDGDTNGSLTTVLIELISGTVQATVAPVGVAPILDVTYTTKSTAGDKLLFEMRPIASTLRMRCASAGVVNVMW